MSATHTYEEPAQRRYAWYVVTLLTLAYILSFIDRFAMGLLINPIKQSLALSDFQIGLLLGPAFALFYITCGIPAGWYADRGNRKRLLVAGIAFWSLTTAAASLATSFWFLFLTRLGLGMGEAVLAPCAISIISDYFPDISRPKAIAMYMSGSLLGAGFAFVGGGQLISVLSALDWTIPGYPAHEWWRVAFVLICVPGLVVAALLLTVREPKRAAVADSSVARPGIGHLLSEIGRQPAAYLAILVPMGGVVILGYASLWYVPLFERSWGYSPRAAGFVIGAIYLSASVLGTLLCGWLSGRMIRRGHARPSLFCVGAGLAIMLPGYIAFPLMPTATLAMVPLFVAIIGQAMATAAGPGAMMAQCPPENRASASAVYGLVTSVFGLTLGPPPIGWMSDHFGGPQNLGTALSLQAVGAGVLAFLALAIWGRRGATPSR